jgi:IS605 OrfB family transposase
MKLTLQIKLLPTQEQRDLLLDTIKEANTVCNRISETIWDAKVFNQYKAHHLVYYGIRNTTHLSAQMVVHCISKVTDAYKLDKKVQRRFKLLGAIAYDTHILSYNFEKQITSIWTTGGRQKIPFVCHNTKYLSYIKGEADLVYGNGKFYLFQTIEVPEEDIKNTEDFIGVDFGIVNLATTSTGQFFSGKQVDKTRKRYQSIRQKLQKCGSPSAKRHLKKLSGKERRFKKNTNHVISKQIVSLAKGTNKGIALENLKGFKVTVRHEQREQFGKWAFNELGKFIEYKAKLAGIPVVYVDPRNTSRTCSHCGYISKSNRKSQSDFICTQCNFSLNADYNAALNIAAKAAVNRPIAVQLNQYIAPSLGTASPQLLAGGC